MPIFNDTGKNTLKPPVRPKVEENGLRTPITPNKNPNDIPDRSTLIGADQIDGGHLMKTQDHVGKSDPYRNISPPEYKGIDTQTSLRDTRHVQVYIEGAKLVVEYYSQILNGDDEGNAFSMDVGGHLQQYRRIRGFEMKITSPFSPSFNDKNEWEGSGTAVLYPGMRPNHGDVFIADMGEGRNGVFNVESVKENSYYKDTTYEIEFSLKGYLTPDILENLTQKSVSKQVFVKDVLLFGETPYYTEERYDLRERLLRQSRSMIQHYLHEFLDNEEYVFLLPVNGKRIYDPELSIFVRNTIAGEVTVIGNMVRELSIERNGVKRAPSLLDVIVQQDEFMLHGIDHQFYLLDRTWFKTPAYLNSVFYSTIEYIVFPKSYIETNLTSRFSSLQAKPIKTGYGQDVLLGSIVIKASNLDKPREQPLIHHVNKDDYYIFSEAFYRKQEKDLSVLEALVLQLIHRKPVNEHQLQRLLDDCYRWNPLDKFYYFPILILLMREVMNRA